MLGGRGMLEGRAIRAMDPFVDLVCGEVAPAASEL